MFASAAQRLADYVPPESFDEGKIYPDLADLRDISLKARLVLPSSLAVSCWYLARKCWLTSCSTRTADAGRLACVHIGK